MKLKNYSIFFLSVMSLSSGGRKGWDFSSYEDCLSFYSNRSFPGQFWNENKSFRDQFWNCLGHSSFIFRFYHRDYKKSYKQLSFRKVWFQKTLSFFSPLRFWRLFLKESGSNVFTCLWKKKKNRPENSGRHSLRWEEKIFIYLFVCFNSPGMTCRKTHPRLHFIEAPNFCQSFITFDRKMNGRKSDWNCSNVYRCTIDNFDD